MLWNFIQGLTIYGQNSFSEIAIQCIYIRYLSILEAEIVIPTLDSNRTHMMGFTGSDACILAMLMLSLLTVHSLHHVRAILSYC